MNAGAGELKGTTQTVQKALHLSADAQPGVPGQDAMHMKEYVHALESAFAAVFGVIVVKSQAVVSSSPSLLL